MLGSMNAKVLASWVRAFATLEFLFYESSKTEGQPALSLTFRVRAPRALFEDRYFLVANHPEAIAR